MAEETDIQAYWSAREELLAREASVRYDAPKKNRLTTLESQADALLAKIKEKERQELWEKEEDLKRSAGMAFRGAVDLQMRKTKLWNILTHMPKGALLHCHLDGTVPATWVIQESQKYDTVIHMCCESPLDSESKLYSTDVSFRALPKVQNDDVFSPSLEGRGWISLREARRLFPFKNVYQPLPQGFFPGQDLPAQSSGDSAGAFDAWLHSLMTMTPAPGSMPMTTAPEAWARFLSTFGIIEGFVSYEPILREYIKQMFLIHAQDGIQYLEARFNFFAETYLCEDAVTPLTHLQWVEIFEQSLSEVKSEISHRSSGDEEVLFDAKIIYVTVRIITPSRLKWYLEDCLGLKRRFPDRIVGFDLVGYEDPGVPLRDYAAELLWFQAQVQKENLDLPFLFHAGETLGDGNRTDQNLYDALLLDTKRIGHGFSLAKHPVLIDMCKQRSICVEVCPISNELLRYTGSVAEHPLPVLLNNGVTVALSNDDPCQFGNFGLSHVSECVQQSY